MTKYYTIKYNNELFPCKSVMLGNETWLLIDSEEFTIMPLDNFDESGFRRVWCATIGHELLEIDEIEYLMRLR